jgi:hypothetical protein
MVMPDKGRKVGAQEAPGAAPRPATEEGAKKKDVVYMRGRDWAIVEHQYNNRVYYYVRTYESERSLADKLADAFEKAAQKGLTDKVSVTYTRWFREKRAQIGFYKNTLIIKVPDYLSYLRLKPFLETADAVARKLYGDVAVDVAAEEEAEESPE